MSLCNLVPQRLNLDPESVRVCSLMLVLALRSQYGRPKDWVLVGKITQGPSLQETVWCRGTELYRIWSHAGWRMEIHREAKGGSSSHTQGGPAMSQGSKSELIGRLGVWGDVMLRELEHIGNMKLRL